MEKCLIVFRVVAINRFRRILRKRFNVFQGKMDMGMGSGVGERFKLLNGRSRFAVFSCVRLCVRKIFQNMLKRDKIRKNVEKLI